jgi:hypothetical protein
MTNEKNVIPTMNNIPVYLSGKNHPGFQKQGEGREGLEHRA